LVPAVQVKVADEPERVLLGVGAVSAGKADVPVPLRAITAEEPVEELLVMVSVPATAPALVGSNCTLRVAVWPAVRVSGSVTPDTVKPVPVSASAVTTTGAVPEEVKVTVCTVGVFSATEPKASVVALRVSFGTAAFRVRETVFETPFAVAFRVTVCAVATEAAVAVKDALVAPAATVMAEGTVTEVLLLDKATLSPPVGAAAARVTVQASVADPVRDTLVQESALTDASADPAAV